MCTSHSSLQMYFLRKITLLIFVLSVLLGASQGVWAATITVNSTGDNIANDGKCTLREAILKSAKTNSVSGAATGECPAGESTVADIIQFATPLSGQKISLGSTIPLDDDVTIKSLTIDASSLSEKIIISGEGSVKVFALSAGYTATLDNIIVMNGNGTTGGGFTNNGTLNIKNSIITGNSYVNSTSSRGGGIYNYNGTTITLLNSVIIGNIDGVISDSVSEDCKNQGATAVINSGGGNIVAATGCLSSLSATDKSLQTPIVVTGDNQTTTVGTAFTTPLSLKVLAGGTAVGGVCVIFTPPTTGATGTFASASSNCACPSGSVCSVTDNSGIATAPIFTANAAAGSYAVQAIISGLTTSFNLTNTATVTQHQLSVTVDGSGTGSVASNPTGISCSSGTCSASFNENTTVTLTATPSGTSTTSWTGTCVVDPTDSNKATVAMGTANKTCTATFNPSAATPRQLSVTVDGSGTGSVASNPTGISCSSGTCSANFNDSSTVTLTITPTSGNQLNSLSGDCTPSTTLPSTTAVTATVAMGTTNKTCTATFGTATVSQHSLGVTVSGSGTVASTSAGITGCTSSSGTCSANFNDSSTVTLTITPTSGNQLNSLSGDCTPSTTLPSTTAVTATVAMGTTNKTCTATFATVTATNYTLSTSTSGSGSVSGGGSYASGTSVTLTASANSGATFASWSGDCSGTSTSTTVTMTSNKSCTATFNTIVVPPPPPPPATFGLGLKKDGTGSGKVFSDTGMECGSYCTDEFESSKTVTLSATPDLGSTFAKFTCSTGETSSQSSLSVRMNAVKICTATFNQVPKYKLNITTTGKATGTVTTQPTATASCGTGCFEFYEGTAVTLVPQPATGAAFTEWSSNCVDGKIIINSAGNSCTATFMPLYTLTVATAGTGVGSVSSTPTGIECGNGKTSCSKIYGEGVSVTLIPTATAGFAFAGWNPECADGKVTLNSHKTCTASFMPIFTLKVAVAGASGGKITSDPAGIDCGTTCSTTVAASTKIALIPTSSQLGVTFTGWSGDCVSSNVVTMDKDKQCTATFANTGTTQFSSKSFEIKEDGKQAVITVKRVSGATGVLTSHYTTADGTAKADGDYTPTTGTLEWKDGETADKTFVVPVNFDNDIEGNETLSVRLLNSSGGVRDEAVLTILDVVVPNALQFSHPLARINESEGKVRLTVVRAANSAGKVSIDYATQDKDAVAGQDYVAQQGTLTWESGDMERKFIEIPVLDNPNKNVNTQFQVVLSNPQPATIAVLGPNKFVTINIVNTATATVAGGSIEFSSDHYDVNESKGSVEILLKRLGSKVGSISVLFATQDGSAIQNIDYIAKQQTVEWADGDDSDKSIILTIPYNALPEADEIVNLTLSNPSPGVNLGAIEKATLRIIDSYASPTTTSEPEKPQRGMIQFGTNSYQAEEGSLVTLKVSRVGGSQDPITVKYMTSNGTAKTGEDYVGRLGELTWFDKESGDKFISINLLDNTVRDTDRSFTVQLLPVNNSAVSNDMATVLVKDNDNTTVQLTAATFTALENAGEATITVSRQQGSVGDVTVYYQLQEETAKAGTDFALASGRLLWLDGDTADKSFGVKLYDNATFNGNRTLKVSLHTPEGASLGALSSATLTIQEDDSSVQPECQPQSGSVECGFDNAGKTLENIKIGTTGTVQGGTLSGKIENLGTVRDVTLQPGTQLTGGNLRGTISGVKATLPVRLIAVKIATATLQHVIIDAQSVLADDVVLGEGVLFESNATIPSVSLAQTLGIITPPFTATFAAINLNHDVLFNSISGGIVSAINELADLKSWGLKLQQNPNTGYLETTLGNTYYAVLPIEVRHVLRQLLNGQMQSGVFMAADGSITFITYTGRWVRAIPVLHDSQAFLVGLNGFGLTEFSVFPNGNFRVPVANTGIYYSARPSLSATRIQTRESVNLDVLRMPIVVNYGDGWQQSLYPAAAQSEAIYALSPEAVLEQDGRVILKLGTGETQHSFYGVFDYVVTPGIATQGDSLFYQIEDKDGDGTPDYRIVYPNGDGQLIFAR